ncbi:hypothetical protein Tco_1041390 [Tanacetum coccineum]|uniref:Uncharacterized protein n=1 Tax=Tanacetum coccineum TaxID=301880 RepID=A0ABQ5GGN1_9ASTR
MARLVRLEKLCVAANSRLVVDAMLVYFQRDTTCEMQYATNVTKLWQELADRVSEMDLFIVEAYGIGEADCRNAYSGDRKELICYVDADAVKLLWSGSGQVVFCVLGLDLVACLCCVWDEDDRGHTEKILECLRKKAYNETDVDVTENVELARGEVTIIRNDADE